MVQLTKEEIIKITMRLQNVRQGLVQKAPFYAVLLFGLRFSLDDMVERVYTDGERIAFNPDFLSEISDRELEFIMLHEVSHVALGHPFRAVTDYDIEIFDEACDIVVNSNIYHYMGDDESFITIKGLGVMPHVLPNGKEGFEFSVEQVYEHLFKIKGKKKKDEDADFSDFNSLFDEEDCEEEDIFEEELLDENSGVDDEASNELKGDKKNKRTKKDQKKGNGIESEDGDSDDNCDDGLDEELKSEEETIDDSLKDEEDIKNKDSSKKSSKSKKQSDSEDGDNGEESSEGNDGDGDGEDSKEGGEQGANGKKGKLGKGQPVKSLNGNAQGNCNGASNSLDSANSGLGKGKILGKGFAKALKTLDPSQIKLSKIVPITRFDDHSFWKGQDEKNMSRTIWENRVLQTYETVKNVKRISIDNKIKGAKCWGSAPCFAERMYKEISERKLDWKTLLNDFIQEDVCDYSFSPPDRRFGDSDFFLPDFNEKEEKVENLLFMIDTSASMSDEQIGEVYSEIKGAIEQFNGKIKGWLGFFDAQVTEPKEFEDEDEFKAIRIQGGGGTAFLPIFHYVREHMRDRQITSIIILTDGYAPYPEEYERMDIPVLWVINNEKVMPPWGMIARIPQKNNK